MDWQIISAVGSLLDRVENVGVRVTALVPV